MEAAVEAAVGQPAVNALLEQAVTRHRGGDLAAAAALYAEILAREPDHLDAVHLSGLIAHQNGDHERAVELITRALEIDPGFADAHNNLGNAYKALDRLDLALASYRRAFELKPEFALALNNIANVLPDFDQAVLAFKQALELDPKCVEAYYNLSVLLTQYGHFQEAFDAAWMTVQLNPEFAPGYNALGSALGAMDRAQVKIAFYRKTLDHDPDNLDALCHIGATLESKRLYAEAARYYQRALALEPDHAESLSRMVDIYLFQCDWESYAGFAERLIETTTAAIANDEPITVDIINLHALAVSKEFTYRAARNKARFTAKRWAEAKARCNFSFQRPARDKIRLGYALPYTWFSSMPLVLKEIIPRHDRDRFEVYGYSIQKGDESKFDKDFRAAFDHFTDVPGAASERAARMIHADGIDILIDTTGHTATNCLAIFALEPAPIQAHYLGYGLTSGSDFLQYLITDPVFMPPYMQAFCSEKLVYLPHTFMATVRAPISDAPVTRAELDLPEDAFVFANFNLPVKFEPVMFSAWMRIMKAVPGSVLWLGGWTKTARDNLRREAESRGVAGARLIFSEIVKHPLHCARLGLADLALDNLYHGGGVTTVDYLWSGLPVLTVVGETPPQRLGATLLGAAEMPELITESLDEFERAAVELARDPERLGALRRKLADKRLTCPLFDTERYVRHLESGYQLMWENHLAGNPPRHIEVPVRPA